MLPTKAKFQQTECDPSIRARLRSLRTERARRRMMADVPNATVVVTNPTHVAIALPYVPTMAVPDCWQGAFAFAERIRASARAAMASRSRATRRPRPRCMPGSSSAPSYCPPLTALSPR